MAIPLNAITQAFRTAVSVTPNDGADLATTNARIYVGGAGNVAVDVSGTGTNVVFAGVPAGTILPISVDKVYSTSTTATNIVALY